MVYYRKYRPQTLEQLDSEEVKKSLQSVLSNKTIPHAFLFTGPKGLGKTSTARIVAKYVNCESTKKEKPCNVCEQCVSITNGTNIDVLEIDGASNRGIDEIRDLREKIRLLPTSATMKVYIIDEVHMLTTEAFNALLKTLEEPPSHAMFLLCTTEPHKVPGTVASRCFHIQFKKATTVDLVRSFERIVKGEHIQADKNALAMIASFADGSFRDGAKILEEISLNLDGKPLTTEAVEAVYHVGSIDRQIFSFLQAFIEKDVKKGLQIIQDISDLGVDIRYFTEKLLFTLHQMLLQKSGIIQEAPSLDADITTIRELAEIFGKVYNDIKYAVLPQLPLELAIVTWGEDKELRSDKEGKVSQPAVQVSSKKPLQNNNSTVSQDNTTDKNFLYELLDRVKVQNHMLAGVLRSCKITMSTNGTIKIETPSTFHKQRLEEKKALEILEEICENITGQKTNLEIT